MDISEKILVSCRKLIEQKGFRGFTMDELALNAGVSKRTVYKYYKSKDEIIEKVIDIFLEQMKLEVDSLINKDEKLARIPDIMIHNLLKHGRFIIMPHTLEDLKLYYPHIWQKIDDFRINQMQQLLKKAVNECEREDLKGIDPIVMSTALVAAVQAVVNPVFILDNNLNFEHVANQLSKLFAFIFRSAQCDI